METLIEISKLRFILLISLSVLLGATLAVAIIAYFELSRILKKLKRGEQ